MIFQGGGFDSEAGAVESYEQKGRSVVFLGSVSCFSLGLGFRRKRFPRKILWSSSARALESSSSSRKEFLQSVIDHVGVDEK